jgi:PAS domain S-box-containing protein
MRELIRPDAVVQQPQDAVSWLAAIVSSSTDAIVGKSTDGVVTSFNPAAERLFGYRAEEIIGEPVRILIPADRHTEEDRILSRIAAGELFEHFDTIRLHKNGSLIDVSISISPVRDGCGRIIGAAKIARAIGGRKRAEEALHESEERFRTLADAIPQLAWMANADGWIYWYNRRWYEYTGTSPEQMEGWGWKGVHDLETLSGVLERWERSITTGEPFEMVFPLRGANGLFRPFLTRVHPLKNAKGRVVQWFGTNTDVEELKRAEAALRESEERERQRRQELETTLAVIPVAVFFSEDKDCARITANATGYKLLRISEGTNASKSASEDERPSNFETYTATGELLPADQLPMQRAAATGKSIEGFEHELRFSDGGHKHLFGNALPLFDAAGEVRGAVGAFLDITERRHQEERLSALAAFNEGALRSLGEGVYTIDCQGLVTSMNPAAEELFGWTFAELRGKKMHDMTHHHYRDGRPFPACECAGFQVLTHEKPLKNHEDVFIHKNGAFFDVIYTITPLRDSCGKIIGLIVVFSDISERKKREAQMQVLLHEVNHRAKNMLAVVQSVARQTAAANPKEFLQRFSERVQALATSQDLLVKAEWRGVELAELVRGQLAHLQDLIGSRIELKGPSLLISSSAAQMLGMTIHELGTNAAKYGALTVAEGRIAIHWGHEDDGVGCETFTMSWREQGGPPVSPPSTNGFGSTVIVAVTESSLDAKVELDFLKTGLRWRLQCPAANIIEGTRFPPAAKARYEYNSPSSSRPKVLVVEDEALVAMEIADVLRNADFEVVGPARAVAQALSLIEVNGCDTAVLDINLSHETSEPIARKLLANGTPFVTLSGYARSQHPPIFDGVPTLLKPLRPALLVAEIEKCLACKQNRQGQLPG